MNTEFFKLKNLLSGLFSIVAFGFVACSSGNTEDIFGGRNFELVDQDSQLVSFPEDFEGKFVVTGFIYTNCPDICSLITLNLGSVQEQMNYPEDIAFVAISFDPMRDTPYTLKSYAEPFGLEENMTFLTGDTTEVYALLDSVRVRTQVSMTQTTEAGEELYFLNHSDKILVLDKNGELLFEYGGSMTKPSIIIEDLNKVR